MTLSRIEHAAHNNATWCNTLCRAHGVPGEFHDAVWINRHPAPRFHSNAITLTDQLKPAVHMAHLQALVTSGLPGRWSVKDCFSALDLAGLGFQLLFEATWLWHAPSPTTQHSADTRTRWTWIRSTPELAHWEAAWGSNPANRTSAPQPRLFVPALLADPDIAFVAGYQDKVIVAGAIANRTDDVVGLSNVFMLVADSRNLWAGCIATVQDRFPGLPLVGYDRGPDLMAAQAAGFERMRDLRVWIHQA